MRQVYCWPSLRTCLEDYYEMMLRCGKCGFCRNVNQIATRHWQFAYQCPPGERYKFEAYYASGMMEIGRALLEGELDYTDRVLDIIYKCTHCGACEEWCKVSKRISPLRIIEEMRIRCVEKGKALPQHKAFWESTEKNYNPYKELHKNRFTWIPEDIRVPQKAEIIYFVGCSSSYRRQSIAEAVVKILKRADIDFGIIRDERCCGSPLFRTGQVEIASMMLRHNITKIREAGAKKVVFSCPGCYRTFSEAPIYGLGELDFEISHITEFLLPIVNKRKVKIGKLKKKLSYHDPCHLGRHMRVYEPPREILSVIPGIELHEMYRNRSNAWCCGSGGGVKSAFPDLALWAAKKRLDELKHIGVQTIVSACPFCHRNLSDAAMETDIDVYDVTEILLMALESEDRDVGNE